VTCEEKKHMSIDMLEIGMARIIRQLKYYTPQLKYLENITHNSRRRPTIAYILKVGVVLVTSFVIGKALHLRR
jgi:hypothetical protein